jgi:hypothetical protein
MAEELAALILNNSARRPASSSQGLLSSNEDFIHAIVAERRWRRLEGLTPVNPCVPTGVLSEHSR